MSERNKPWPRLRVDPVRPRFREVWRIICCWLGGHAAVAYADDVGVHTGCARCRAYIYVYPAKGSSR